MLTIFNIYCQYLCVSSATLFASMAGSLKNAVLLGTLVLVATAYVASGNKAAECRAAYDAAGGESALASRLPACSTNAASFDFTACCSQAKTALSAAPSGCLCDGEVWKEVESRMTGAGIEGLNAESLRAFTRACGIPNRGAGTC